MKSVVINDFIKTTLAAVVGGCVTLGVYTFFNEDKQVVIEKAPSSYTRIASNPTGPDGDILQPDFSVTAEKVTPAVVHIRSTTKAKQSEEVQTLPLPFRDFFGDDTFGRNFGPFNMPPYPAQSSGSGVIISNEGYILTNEHVIEKADEIEVTLYDKRTFKAKVVGTDPSTDLALIQIQGKNLPVLPLGNSDNIKVGQWVLAVGNPFNLESTVTAGIISAKGRSINILHRDKTPIESFIQTDAAVNPGNSGGALVNINGELIGINTAIATTNGTFAGYSFAIPANIASKIVEDIIKYGKVQRAFLGITIRDVNGKLAEEKDLQVTEGAYVDSLLAGGAAMNGGIKIGDVIVNVDDKPIKSVAELQETIGLHRPGDKVTVIVNRKGQEKKLTIPLKNMAGNTTVEKDNRSEEIKALGAEFSNLSEQDKKKSGVDYGVKVTRLFAGKLRSYTEVREGFIITKINRTPVRSVNELLQLLESQEGGVMIEGVYPGDPTVYYYAFGM